MRLERMLIGTAMIATGVWIAMTQVRNASIASSGAEQTPLSVYAAEQTAERPKTQNARVEERAVSGTLADSVKSWAESAVQPQWLGYTVPEIGGERRICCGNWNDGDGVGICGPCKLEGDHVSGQSVTKNSDAVKLEGPTNLIVLLRAENRKIAKVRIASEDCTLDAGGLPFVWLTGVKSAESVDLLASYVRNGGSGGREENRLEHDALTAIAMHADAAADRALETFTTPDQREELRKRATFWLGEARGKTGFALLQKMAKNDPSSEVRSQVTFALSVSKEPGAIDEMIRMAHEDQSIHVRGQALFWLAQKAGKKAASAITGAIDNDPDTDVKKKAVFALSQMPKDEGVPKLIEVAQNNRNPEVRKQAMFWLGQSNDPRALAFFEKVLLK